MGKAFKAPQQSASLHHAAAKREMAGAQEQAIAQFREHDRAYAEEGPEFVGAEGALTEPQKAGIATSGGFCPARSLTFFGGSMRPMVHFACLAMITRSRTENLRWLLDQVSTAPEPVMVNAA